MKPSALLFLALFAFFAVASFSAEPANDAAPLPAPPMQGKPWTPPDTKLPDMMVKSIQELFDQGMADPRGCEYREVEVDPWSNGERKIKVHAWVLPGPGEKKYAVGWNGRVIQVTSVGEAADLRKDFSADTHGLGQFNIGRWTMGDFQTLNQKTPLPIKVAILLRLGEADLAEGVWREGYKGNGNMLANDPYSEMAREWLDSWYGRALSAHLNGDDHLALQMFRALVPLKKTVQAAADDHGITGLQPGTHYLDEINQLDDLAADQERRAKEPPHVPALKADLTEGPERIAALIRDLELVHGEQLMNPGQTELTFDPIVQALIKEGEPAVEPLIACLDEDPPRMTHTMFTQGMIGEGPVEYVYEPAYVILTSILKTTVIIPLPQGVNPHQLPLDSRKALAAKFRDYWAKYKSKSPAERWFSVLADDNATPREWFESVSNIVQRSDQASMGGNMFSGESWSSGGSNPNALMRGESLRNKANPSVSDLLIKRFNQSLDMAGPNQGVTYANVSNLIFALADWDGKAHLDDLKTMGRQLNAKTPNVFDPASGSSSESTNVTLYEKRFDLGDAAALQEYADWLLSMSPKRSAADFRVDDYRVTTLRFMWEHPTEPVIRKTSEKMFLDKNSAWYPVSPHDHGSFSGLVTTPLLGLPAFREEILRGLDDKTEMGFVRNADSGNPNVEINGEDDLPQFASMPHVNYRVCDRYAAALARVQEFPDFQYNWPEARRDAAIAACKAFLKQYGDGYQYQYKPNMPDNTAIGTSTQLRFPPLDHPATPEDVAQGRAIFSLTGEVRICKLKFPIHAKRPASKEDPQTGSSMSSDGKAQQTTVYATEGSVWQAEDVKIDGKWQRFYGFAGRHQLEKVPASEIEFPVFGFAPVTPELEGMIDSPETKDVHKIRGNNFAVVGPDVPLPVAVNLHNHASLDQEIPAALLPPANATKTLPDGIALALSYSEKIPPQIKNTPEGLSEEPFIFMMGAPAQFDYGAWADVPLRKEVTVASGKDTGSLVNAGDLLAIFQFDLRDYFDTSRPGTYRLQATFQAPGQPAGKSGEIMFTVLAKTK